MGKIRSSPKGVEVEFDLQDVFTHDGPVPYWLYLFSYQMLKKANPTTAEKVERGSVTLEGNKVKACFFYPGG